MGDDKERILSKTIDLKRRGLAPYKRLHVQGEAVYDYAAYVSARRKKPCLKVADGSGSELNSVPSCSSTDGSATVLNSVPSCSSAHGSATVLNSVPSCSSTDGSATVLNSVPSCSTVSYPKVCFCFYLHICCVLCVMCSGGMMVLTSLRLF